MTGSSSYQVVCPVVLRMLHVTNGVVSRVIVDVHSFVPAHRDDVPAQEVWWNIALVIVYSKYTGEGIVYW